MSSYDYRKKRKPSAYKALLAAGVLKETRPQLSMTEQLADEICYYMAEYGEPLGVVCRRDNIPSLNTIRAWLSDKPDWQQRFADAKETGAHLMAYRLRGVARGEDGSTRDVVRDKLVVDTDMKLLNRWHPNIYGDKVTVDTKLSLEELVMQSMKVAVPPLVEHETNVSQDVSRET